MDVILLASVLCSLVGVMLSVKVIGYGCYALGVCVMLSCRCYALG